ncbi:Hypothetical protein POVN_LOCUS410 [uncultured virus]|nr:Hypothetical protein POVN_LOCUS410 [uncultured virus]
MVAKIRKIGDLRQSTVFDLYSALLHCSKAMAVSEYDVDQSFKLVLREFSRQGDAEPELTPEAKLYLRNLVDVFASKVKAVPFPAVERIEAEDIFEEPWVQDLEEKLEPLSSAGMASIWERLRDFQETHGEYYHATLPQLLDGLNWACLFELIRDTIEDTPSFIDPETKKDLIGCYDINRGLYNSDLAVIFADVLPPPQLCGWGWITTFNIKNKHEYRIPTVFVDNSFKELLPHLQKGPHVQKICYHIVEHLIKLFAAVPDERFEAWLDTLPGTNADTNLNMRCKQKVIILLTEGIEVYKPTTTITYEHLVYAVVANPKYDLSPYLRSLALE